MIRYTNPKQFTQSFIEGKPYPHITIPTFFTPEIILGVTNAISNLDFFEKTSDLFHFYQTSDLASIEEPTLLAFKEYLYSEQFVAYIEAITNTKLSTKADLFVSIYQDTNYLLPHDDKVSTRKIAFLVYLSDFEPEEGGALEIWDNDSKEPTQISHTIIPKDNTMVLFEVSDTSFHAVEEVTVDKQRIAITGWYHER
jgi:Rps23 Pro-64 3,4-dihydroxylase Tpa1-like proline 4-hydroxylase